MMSQNRGTYEDHTINDSATSERLPSVDGDSSVV